MHRVIIYWIAWVTLLSASVSASLLRPRRLSTMPLTPNFHFDGSTSDLAQQFYRRHLAGDTAEPLRATHGNLPDRIKTRLDDKNLRFEQLSPLLQRAVVWDTGYGIGPDGNFVRIYTTKGVPMSKIAVTLPELRSTLCTTTNCSDPDGWATYRSNNCTGEWMLSVSHCASESVPQASTHTSMWATGGSDDMIPTLVMLRHFWTDPFDNKDYTVFAIHTMAPELEPQWSACPAGNAYGSIIIPCDSYSPSRAKTKQWFDPAPGELVAHWLDETHDNIMRKRVMFFVMIPILCVLGIAMAFGAFCCVRHRRQSKLQTTSQPVVKDTWINLEGSSLQRALIAHQSVKDPLDTFTTRDADGSGSLRMTALSSDRVTHVLLQDPNLQDCRISMQCINFTKLISSGGFGEVWLADIDGQTFAVKRLLQGRRVTMDDVETFTDEIQLVASLRHPNIVRFVAVAWTTLENLCMLTEYLPGGDLQSFLKRRGHELTWAREKRQLAIGIARAVHYLHTRAPVLIHRDIKSRNILVRDSPLEAKLSDFGVSRSIQRECMTLGVGTPYWTAPEVLEGTVYTEKSDIYSFGVVLSELDTCQAPYHEVQYGNATEHIQPFHILKMVMAGTIQPQFSDSCPAGVKELALSCLNVNPQERPSARDVVRRLASIEQWTC
ncbi:hypothetical protein Poli38472_011973 [Pythium oligandrum]|uniref:Protein kinase domain-containing protein n=1 Tax=Pythium oligandrum TaxID=41045 RepID=A0A8K1FPF1_PYTOL|nr:hypothetical protein Poli38472_011973 [Pythium oligandrum]|eukprot:TMW66857.1 hypothetical protein Poli38472_011973 [Pythium oligandrum]